MLALENADEILQILDRFTKQKSKDIPPELEEYINYVAKTGDTVYRWPTVQYLFREKLRNVIKDFHDTTASIEDLPQCPNVDQFNYESMKTLLFERFDSFQAAPFTIQRLCELLTDPKKHYSRLDKFMRALEKNILVVSTVEPGRKPIETEENGDASVNGDILSDINIDLEISKSDDKRPTNGTTEKHIECNTNDHITEEVASSSGITQISSENDDNEKKEEIKKADEKIPEKSIEPEKVTESSEAQPISIDESVGEKETPIVNEPVEKPIDSVEKVVAEKEDSEAVKVEKPETESIATPEKVIEPEIAKTESESIEKVIDETPVVAPVEEIKIDEEIKETIAEKQVIETEKPPTPKHARSTSDEEDIDADPTSNPCAKKIRLELDEEPKDEAKKDVEPIVAIEPIIAKADIQKESEILDKITSEIDAQKENELLDDVVDSALAVEKDPLPINIEPIAEKVVSAETVKPAEETATEVLLKPDEPVATIPSDLDFTPDEALNELVSSDILSVIPEQPTEEVKMSDESANIVEPVAAADAMTVESSETATNEVENAMESAPIKADEEQMDVDESNSVDAMDL